MDEIVDINYPNQRLICIAEEVNATRDQLAHLSRFEEWQRQEAKSRDAISDSAKCQQAGSGMRQRTAASHQCHLCGKIFGNSNALNKHLLTHQPDRPHVCPTCHRAFKRPDHLAGHMLTHQKRRLFHCIEPGCQRSYCDAHSLKRHCLSQHGSRSKPAAAETASTHLHVRKLLGAVGDTQSEQSKSDPSSYPPVYLSTLKAAGDTQSASSSYHGFVNYNSFSGFSTVGRGLGGSQYAEGTTSVEKPLLTQEQWMPASAKGVFSPMSKSETLLSQDTSGPSQWSVGSVQEPSCINVVDSGMAQSFGSESLGTTSWEKALEFPVMDLQVLDSMLSCQSSSTNTSSHNGPSCQVEDGPAYSNDNSLLKPRQHADINSGLTQVKKLPPKADILPPWPISGHDFAIDTLSATAQAQPQLSLLSGDIPILSKKVEKSKKRSKKRTILAEEGSPLPVCCDMSVPRRPRPRPDFLISPSQVAMASFSSDNVAFSSLKETSLSAFTEGDGTHESPERVEYVDLTDGGCSWEGPASTACNSKGPHSPVPIISSLQLGQAMETTTGEAPASQRSPPCTERKSLSPLIIPVSVPVAKGPADDTSGGSMRQNFPSSAGEMARSADGTVAKKSRRQESLKTLIIPSPRQLLCPLEQETVGSRVRATGGYLSQLRSPIYLAGQLLNPEFQPAPYTPPPMLSPLRPGSGLYFSKLPQQQPCPPMAAAFATAIERKDGISLVVDNSIVSIEPRINVGSRFQAEIPPLRNRLLMLYEEHPAQLVWSPWGDIATNPDTQDRVTEFLNLCCSSVLPGGGTNTELALHCLHEVQGDVLAALDLLLVRGDFRSSSHPLSDYHYTGSSPWTAQEKKIFHKAVLTENKDFQRIHCMFQSKTVFQCVEYYYAMKKIKKFKQRSHGDKRDTGLDPPESPPDVDEQQVSVNMAQRPLVKSKPASQQPSTATEATLEYTCEECGRSFEKIRSRSAHMKTHRHQERNLSTSTWGSTDKAMAAQHKRPGMEPVCTSESDSP